MDEAACRAVRESGVRRRLHPTGLLVMVAAGSLLLAACGTGSADASHPSSTAPRPTSTTRVTSMTGGGTEAAVLAAYRAGWTAYEAALASANPADPALAATMVDPLLQRVKANLYAYRRQGIVGRGPVDLNPKVVALSSSTATVVDCTFSSSELVYASTGKPVPPATPPEHDGVRATLVLTASTWKVSEQSVTEGTCAAGS